MGQSIQRDKSKQTPTHWQANKKGNLQVRKINLLNQFGQSQTLTEDQWRDILYQEFQREVKNKGGCASCYYKRQRAEPCHRWFCQAVADGEQEGIDLRRDGLYRHAAQPQHNNDACVSVIFKSLLWLTISYTCWEWSKTHTTHTTAAAAGVVIIGSIFAYRVQKRSS